MAIGSACTRYQYAPENGFSGIMTFKIGIAMHNVDTMHDHVKYDERNKARQPALLTQSKHFESAFS
uniref:Lipoprotein n=1 Tax=Mesocestoides corti TaxID=53468 RepID=A0A5K3G289_MESCO